MPVKERNRSIDILRAIAIVLVVLGHSFPIPGCEWWQSHFSAGSYRMALFLFISGYLFRDIEWSDLPSFVWRKTKNLVFPLIGWNIVYAGIVSIINFRHPVNYLPSTEQVWNMHDLFIEPFITGHQYLLNLATWFVGLLYIAILLYGLIHLLSKRLPAWGVLILYTIVAAVGLYCNSLQLEGKGWLVVERILFALYFIQLGKGFRIYFEPLLKAKHLWWTMLLLLGAWCAVVYGTDKTYLWAFMNFSGAIVRPIVAGTLGCLFWMVACKLIALLIPKNGIETAIGNGTWSIMTNHLLVRFLFCWIFVHFWGNDTMQYGFQNDFWFFPRSPKFLSGYTLLYLLSITLEVSLPVLWQIYFDRFKARLARLRH